MHKSPMLYTRLFSPYLNTVVVTQEQLDKFKHDNIRAEIEELEELIEGHRGSIARLQRTIDEISKELPEEKQEVKE